MRARTLPLDCSRKVKNQRFLCVFLERNREKVRERICLEQLQELQKFVFFFFFFFFFCYRRSNGIYIENVTLRQP